MIVANRINGVRVVSIAARPVYWSFTGVGLLALAVLTWAHLLPRRQHPNP
jgi:hypothetical protein